MIAQVNFDALRALSETFESRLLLGLRSVEIGLIIFTSLLYIPSSPSQNIMNF
jgi:hypothetical protein